MLAIIIFIFTVILGLQLINFLPLKINRLEQLCLSLIIGLVAHSWALFLLVFFFGYNFGIIFSLILILLIKIIFKNKNLKIIKLTKKNKKFALSFFVIISLIFTLLFFTRNFQQKTNGLYSGSSSWGDLALHVSYINYFEQQNKFSLQNPIYANQKTSYSFLLNFYASILKRSGANLQVSLILSSLPIILAASILFYFLGLRLFKNQLAAFLAPLIFYFNGGIGIYYFLLDFLKSKQSLLFFLLNQPVSYANYFDKNLFFTNTINDFLLPQRSFVIGFGIFIVSLFLLQQYFKKYNYKILFFLASLIGLTPLLHPHSFLALFGLEIFLLFFLKIKQKITYKKIILILIISLGLSLPQLLWQASNSVSAGFIRFNFAWMKPENQNIIIFWLRNMGLGFIFLSIFNILFLAKSKNYLYLKLLITAFLILFVLTNLIIFQPYVYDNSKLILYSYLITSISASYFLSKLNNKFLIIILFLCLTITGIISVIKEASTSWQIASNNDIQTAQWIKANTNPEAIFLTSDKHNHLVPMLAGRKIIMGYRGWLWTHGIDYSQTEADVKKMFEHPAQNLALFKKYKINYIFVGDSERVEYRIDEEWFEDNFEVVYKDQNQLILKSL